MVEDQMFTVPYVLPILRAALFCSGAATIFALPGFETWAQARFSAVRRHPTRVALVVAGALSLIAGATRVVAPTGALVTPESPSTRFAV